MAANVPLQIKTIEQFHRIRGLTGPAHPFVSVLRFEDMLYQQDSPSSWVLDFYSIAIKKNFNAKLKYGQQSYDFDNGVMTFMAPGQKIGIEVDSSLASEHSGWLLIFQNDFLWNTSLAKNIKQYDFFSYSVKEALFLSEEEELILNGIMETIKAEYHRGIDSFTQNIIVSQIEVLLAYAERFYQRQFITRKHANHSILTDLEMVLKKGFLEESLHKNKVPTVVSVAQALNVSPNYLSGLLKTLTGKSTQEHIHDKLIAQAKELLSTTNLTVSQVAYFLGYSYPQTFSKLFKSKTTFSPVAFRKGIE